MQRVGIITCALALAGCATEIMYDFPGKTQDQANRIIGQCAQQAGVASYGNPDVYNVVQTNCIRGAGGIARR